MIIKRLFKFLSPIYLIFIFSSVALANGNLNSSIKGQVLSVNDKSPIPYATIYVEQTQSGTVSDELGNYELKINEGEYTLTVSVMGYESLQRTLDVKANSKNELNFMLTPLTLEIEEVVVKGKSQTASLQQKGFTINNVSTKLAVAQSFSTEELLNRSAGIRLRQGGGMGSETEYNINGLSGNSVKVYIDGMPISSYGRSFSISNIPASSIERVEVYKGVVPAHLADDALGGAINVIMKKTGVQMLDAAYSYGSLGTHTAEINGLYKNQKTGFFIGGTANYNVSKNNYKVWGDAVYVTDPKTGRVENITAERFHDSYSSYGVNLNTGVMNKSWADELSLNMIYNSIDKDIQNGATMEIVYGNRRSTQDSYVTNLRYRKNDLIDRLDFNTNFSYSYSDQQLIDTTNVKYDWSGNPVKNIYGDIVHWGTTGEGGRATLASNLENNFNNRTTVRYALDDNDNHILSLNGSYRFFSRDIDDPMLSTLEQGLTETRKISKHTLSASYDGKYLDDRLYVSAFYKYFGQNLSLSDPLSVDGVITPNDISVKLDGSGYGLTASYKLLPYLRINTSAERALRLPGVTEMIGNAADNIEANYNIRPEKSININLGAGLEDYSINRNVFNANFNLFYRDVTDMIQRAEISKGDETYGFENIGKILSKGVDAEVKYTYDGKLNVYGAASYTDARFNLQYDANGAQYAWYGDKLRNMPYFMANAGVSYSFNNLFKRKHKLLISYHFNYIHEFFKNWESLGTAGKATIPTQMTHDIGLTYALPNDKISFSIDAKNIFNEQLFDNYALQKPGRMIFGKIRYKIF